LCHLGQLLNRPVEQLLEERYQKFRRMGLWSEESAPERLRDKLAEDDLCGATLNIL
jgi:hypothetical protein